MVSPEHCSLLPMAFTASKLRVGVSVLRSHAQPMFPFAGRLGRQPGVIGELRINMMVFAGP